MKKNILINLITLSITSLLLVLVVMAWYVSNTVVTASGITAKTADGNFELLLQRGEYNDNSWTWTDTKSLSISNMQPADVFFFRFKITARTSGSLKVNLSGISSQIPDDVLTLGDDNKSVYVSGTKYYELTSNAVVIKNGETTLGTLYNYSNGTFTLDDFLVHETFNYLDYGLGTANFYKPDTTTYYTTDISECPKPAQDLTNISANYTISTAGEHYGYFALEFNDAKSLKTYTHIDGVSKTDSNLYQAQTLSISTISVESGQL